MNMRGGKIAILIVAMIAYQVYQTGVLMCLGKCIIVYNRFTGFKPEPANSDEYNAVLRLISFLPFKKHGARAVTEMKEKRECRDSSVLRPINDYDELRHTRNGKVPFTFTKFGSAEPAELTILFAHGGGMIAGCMQEQQAISDFTAKIWKERLNLKSVQIANVEYRLLPENTMIDALDDFVEVYEELLNRHGADPRKTMFTGCSGGGAIPLYTYLYLLQQNQIPLPGLIVAHSPAPGMEWATNNFDWEQTDEWERSVDNDAFFFSREAGRQWGREWDQESKDTLSKWFSNDDLISKLGPNVIITSAEKEMFAATHRHFMTTRPNRATFISYPNRTHCLQQPAVGLLLGDDGVRDTDRLFEALQHIDF